MDKKGVLNKIKELINFSGDVVENKFIDAKLNDGVTIVRVEGDNFEVGYPLLLVTPDGLIPAPTGSHTLEDGTVIEVDEAGKITSVTAGEAPAGEETPATIEQSAETEDFYSWDQCMLDMMDEYNDEGIASAVCGKIKADGYIMSKEEAFAEGAKISGEVSVDGEEMKKKYTELESRLAEVEKMMTEMLPVMKQSAEFSTAVLEKLDGFVKDTPAQLEFASIKSEYKNTVEKNKSVRFSGLEGIKNMRKK